MSYFLCRMIWFSLIMCVLLCDVTQLGTTSWSVSSKKFQDSFLENCCEKKQHISVATVINQKRTFPNTETKRNQLDATSAALLIITDKILCKMSCYRRLYLGQGTKYFQVFLPKENLHPYLVIWSANLIHIHTPSQGFRSTLNIYIIKNVMLILLRRTPYARVGSWSPISHIRTPSLEACKDQNQVLCPSDLLCQGVNLCSCKQHRAVLHIEWKSLSQFSVRVNLDILVNCFIII